MRVARDSFVTLASLMTGQARWAQPMKTSRIHPTLVLAATFPAHGFVGPRAEEPMLYVVEGGRLIFTNVPSAANARPAPRF